MAIDVLKRGATRWCARLWTAGCLAVAAGGVSCSREAKPPAAPANDRPAQAKVFIEYLAKQDFAGAVSKFDPTMARLMPEAKLQESWVALLVQTGEFHETLTNRAGKENGFDVVATTCQFEKARVDISVAFNPQGEIAGIFFTPSRVAAHRDPPSYADSRRYEESPVVVGEGEWSLPGTLTMPKGPGPFPGVVLVQGWGPADRDQTTGGNKTFRDLSSGLGARDIAVIRFEKRSKAHGPKFASYTNGFTVKEEVTDDALAAARLLRSTSKVNPQRVFILGHSLGAILGPRMAAQDPKIAGIILMAPASRKLEETLVEQMTYIFNLDDHLSPEETDQLRDLKAQAARVRALGPADASGTPLLGVPASYWVDLNAYDPIEAARNLQKPILILRGARDYQVTLQDFDAWKTGLGSKPDVAFHSFPSLNHLFIPGEGKSTPAEYQTPSYVAKEVVEVIAAWVNQHAGSDGALSKAPVSL